MIVARHKDSDPQADLACAAQVAHDVMVGTLEGEAGPEDMVAAVNQLREALQRMSWRESWRATPAEE